MDFTMGAAAEGPLKLAAESKTVRGGNTHRPLRRKWRAIDLLIHRSKR